MLKFVLDHLKTVNMCKHAVKKLPFVIKYVPDCLKTKEMCVKLFQKMAVINVNDNYSHASKFVLDCYKNQKM